MSIKRRKKHGRVYLEEYKSVRVGGKVKSVYVQSLGPEKPVSRAPRPKARVLDRLEHGNSYRAGDVTLLWEMARQQEFPMIIDEICCGEREVEGPSPGKLLTAWAINRVLDPLSATSLENWIPTTDLPRLLDLNPAAFTKENFLSALDFICFKDQSIGGIRDFTPQIDDALYRRWRERYPLKTGEKETLAYDLTSILFFGVTCPLTELGYNPERIKRQQVNLALIVSRRDKYPISHITYNGNRNSSSTVKNLLARLQETSIEPGTIIWDRGNVSHNHVKWVESAGWKLICGVPKTGNEALGIIDNTEVPLKPTTFVHKSRLGHIYAVKAKGRLFGRERSVVVYSDPERRIGEINSQNEALAEIGEELDALSERGKNWSEAKLHKEIESIVGPWKNLVHTRVKRTGGISRIEWRYQSRELTKVEQTYGKYLLLSTDESLSVKEIVKTYLEKDYIEKVFRTLKTLEKVEPVRHRLETRVRAYMFVCVLAYRLIADLHHRILELSGGKEAWERGESFLKELGRVERVQVKLGHQVKTWYLNLSKKNREILEDMGFSGLLKEVTEVDLGA